MLQTKIAFLLVIGSCFISLQAQTPNNRPVIALLTAPSTFDGHNDPGIDSYVLGQDIRYMETGGSRAAWLNWNWTETKFTTVLKSANGIAITQVPNDTVSDAVKTKFQQRITQILQYADVQYSLGKYYPIYAHGDAFKAVLQSLAKMTGLFTNVSASTSLKLNVTQNSRLYSFFSTVTESYVEGSYATFFGNKEGLSIQAFNNDSVLSSFFQIAATATDLKGNQFIAALEGKNHPFYFLQYLPHDIIYDWTNPNIRQNLVSQQAALAIANFFVNETRSNYNNFSSASVEDSYLLYNRNATIVSVANPNVYFFHLTS